MENPVKRPIVPPTAESLSTNLAALSFVTLSKTGALNIILTYFKFGLCSSYSKKLDNYNYKTAKGPQSRDSFIW